MEMITTGFKFALGILLAYYMLAFSFLAILAIAIVGMWAIACAYDGVAAWIRARRRTALNRKMAAKWNSGKGN